MADLLNRANVDTAINTLLDDAQPNEAIQPSDHNGLLKNILDTLANGLSVTLRTNPETSGQDIEITSGDKLKYKNSTFFNSVVTDTLTADRTLTLPNKTGTIAILSDIENLFTDDLTLGANRSHNAVEYDWKITHNATDGSVNAVGIDTGKISHAGSRTATNSSYLTNWFWGQFSSVFTNTSTSANTSINQTNASLQLTNTDSVNDTTFLNLSPTTYNANHTGATTQSDLALTGTQSTLINQSGIGTNLATAKLDLTNSLSIFYYDVGDTLSYIEAGPTKTFLKFEETGATPGGGDFEMSRSTGHSFTDNNTNGSGLKYGADYSANYTSRSLVDKAYVDANAGGDSIYTADGSLSGDRTVDLNDNKLTFDIVASTEAEPVKLDFGGVNFPGSTTWDNTGAVKIKTNSNVDTLRIYKTVDGSNPNFVSKFGGGGHLGTDGTAWTVAQNYGTTSTRMELNHDGIKQYHGSGLQHSNIMGGAGSGVKFWVGGFSSLGDFIVGGSSSISTEDISLQGDTVIKGGDTLGTSSALRIYDGDSTPNSLWDFRNNGDIIANQNPSIIGGTSSLAHFKFCRSTNSLNNTSSFSLDLFDSANNQTTYARFGAKIIANTIGSEYGEANVQVRKNGTITTLAEFDSVDGLSILSNTTTNLLKAGDVFTVSTSDATVYGSGGTLFQIHRPNNGAGGGVGFNIDLNNSSNAQATYSRFVSIIESNTAGSHTGRLELRVADSGTVTTKVKIKPNTINVNMPTSSAGLSSGDLYNDGGTVKIV